MLLDERFEIFKKKVLAMYPDGHIDLSKFKYINNRTKGCVIDHSLKGDGTEYGEYWQTPSNILKGQEHPGKRSSKISKSKRFPIDKVLEKCRSAHPNENLEYFPDETIKNYHSFIRIVDHDLKPDGTEYGEYWQEINSHIRGCVHPQKAIDRNADKQRYTTKEFREKGYEIHANDDYDLSEAEYIDYQTKVKVICNKIGSNGKPHGEFWITPDNFLHGKGCPKCGNHLSHGEEEILEFLQNNGVKCEHCDHETLNGLEIDILIPSKKLGIEFDGLKWHSEKYGKDKMYHLKKTLQANDKGIGLVHIFEDEWLEHKSLVLSKIGHLVGMDGGRTRIRPQKCKITEIPKEKAKEFLDKWHPQGFISSTVYYGAYYDNSLIAVMTFKYYSDKNEWELNRFAASDEYIVIGLGGRIFKHFVLKNDPVLVKSFADRRWTIDHKNNLYTKLGFTLEEICRPDYRYVVGNERRHKFGFMKQILHKKYGLPLSMTELEMAKALGYDWIWDCGLFKYVWKKKSNLT